MQILVLGATGFIGLPVSQALIRAGHVVYGQTRSADKARQLTAEEIIPIVGDAHDLKIYEQLLANTDVVIDIGTGNDANSATILAGLTAAATSIRHAYAPKLTYIYCSGTWVHGDNRTDYVSDSTPALNPAAVTGWRAKREQEIIKSQALNGIIVRPSMLYGRSGSLFVPLFKSAYEGNATWYGTPGGRFAMIHQDDLADFFLKVVEKSPQLGGLIFDATNPNTESVVDVLEQLVRVSGASKYSFVKPSNAYEEGLAATSLIRPHLGRTLLGWNPVKATFADGMATWYAAYKASAGLQ